MQFLKINKIKIFLFIFFTFYAAGSLFLRGRSTPFVISNPPDAIKKPSFEQVQQLLPKNAKICHRRDYYEIYFPKGDSLVVTPFFNVFYGKICSKFLLFLFNLPYYYLLALIGYWLIKKFPLAKK